MARTKADQAAQIADDLARGDLTDQITVAQDWACDYYQDDRFLFNEVRNASATLSSSLAYMPLTVPPQSYKFLKIDRVAVLINSTYREVIPMDYATVMRYQDGITFSSPCYYCIYGDRMEFDQFADMEYTINLDGLIHLGSQQSQSFSANDTSAWFNVANELIRSAVKRNLYGHVIKDERMAAMAVEAEQDAYSMLKGMYTRKKTVGKVTPNWF